MKKSTKMTSGSQAKPLRKLEAELHNTLKRHTAEDEEFSKKNKK